MGQGRNQIKRRWESLVLNKSFNTLWDRPCFHRCTAQNIPRVPQGLSPRLIWDPQPLSLQASVCSPPPPPNQRRGEYTRLRVRGWGSHISDDWRISLVLCLYSVPPAQLPDDCCSKINNDDISIFPPPPPPLFPPLLCPTWPDKYVKYSNIFFLFFLRCNGQLCNGGWTLASPFSLYKLLFAIAVYSFSSS